MRDNGAVTRIVIIGGGPGGYEAALVAADLGADVTVVDRDGIGGSCVLWDCVPSKSLIATSEKVTAFRNAPGMGVNTGSPEKVTVDLHAVNRRVKALAIQQSQDIAQRLARSGVRIIPGVGRFSEAQPGRTFHVEVTDGAPDSVPFASLEADAVMVATGASPRILPGAEPDGKRILSWRQVYDLHELPGHLVVVGSGVTGAEFASGYLEMGIPTTLVSSRDQVLPGEDPAAAAVIEWVFTSRGGKLVKRARASGVTATRDSATVQLIDGRTVEGTHVLMCVGSTPNTDYLGLENVGLKLDDRGYLPVDRVSRTAVPGIYAAGDCTGLMALASVAGMQGRNAMWHALGMAVTPLRLKTVAANVFTHPEIATVGIGPAEMALRQVPARTVTVPLNGNARAKMQGLRDGFVKLYCRTETGIVIGGVIVAPEASELIMPVTLAVQRGLTVSELANTASVYPSLSGSVTEAARMLMRGDDLE
ncbi:MAG: lpdA [Jatrophihabitantaceae bacterium]|nr:lpdA [Jatrophihabitantaceae bacterium]